MSSTQTNSRNKTLSRTLRLSGLALWILTAVAAFGWWRMTRDRKADADVSPVGSLAANDAAETFTPIPEVASTEADGKAGERRDRNGMLLPWDEKGLPDFEFTERSGKKVTKADLVGKPWAACFIFTNCAGPCPKVTGQMKLLQDRLKDVDVRLVTFTVDPERDTPERLTKWANQFDADPEKWLFLTGDRNAIYRLIIDGFKMPVREVFGEDRKPGYEFLHTTNVMLVDPQGRVIEKFDANRDEDMSSLFKAIKHEAQPPKPTRPSS